MAEKKTDKKPKAVICTKNDEFQTSPCVCITCVEERGKTEPPVESILVITDEHLCPEGIRSWTGHVFVCPKCNEYEIMYQMHHCPKCGTKIKIQSRTLTEFIKSRG